ncbi:MAG: biotin/lipoyl-containing protein [Bryobacteraceae bacterium]
MKLRVTVEGKTYEVDVEVMDAAPEQAEPAEPSLSIPEAVLKPRPPNVLPEDKILRSPIAGLITAVPARAGMAVARDEPLIVIEAMKMESNLGAPVAGVVKNVQVTAGETVRAGQVLVELA